MFVKSKKRIWTDLIYTYNLYAMTIINETRTWSVLHVCQDMFIYQSSSQLIIRRLRKVRKTKVVYQTRPNLKNILFWILSKSWSLLMGNNFPKRPSGAPLHTLLNYIWCSWWFCNTFSFETTSCFICGGKNVTVTRHRMICLVHRGHGYTSKWSVKNTVNLCHFTLDLVGFTSL